MSCSIFLLHGIPHQSPGVHRGKEHYIADQDESGSSHNSNEHVEDEVVVTLQCLEQGH